MSIDPISDDQRSQLEELAEQYVNLHRNGKKPSIETFVRDHPELEADIRELFPVMLMLDKGQETDDQTPSFSPDDPHNGDVGRGSQLGDYVLLQPIGRGGMGVVYEAEHRTLHNRVAIKLLPHSFNRPKLQARFLREASAAARMNHPNIVRVFGYGNDGQVHYYVMSLVEGVGLDQMVTFTGASTTDSKSQPATHILNRYRSLAGDRNSDRSHGPENDSNSDVGPNATNPDSTAVPKVPSTVVTRADSFQSAITNPANSLWEWVAQIGVQAADALSYAHEMGVIHRDVKPSNLMLDGSGKLFVTDFGLAKLSDDSSLTETGDLLGTLRYISPESLHGNADHRSDIYGLGLTLYELLCGEPAYGNSDRAKLFHDISLGYVEPLNRRVPKVPRDLASIVRKAIEADPMQRYESASAMCSDLRKFLRGEPVEARPASLGYRTSRWVARNTVISVLVASIFLLLSVATIAASLSARGFSDLAKALETKSETALVAKDEAVEQTHLAKRTLLAAQLSDAKSSSVSRQLGRKKRGLSALKDAIRLSRELGVFETHRHEINSTATVLGSLHDVDAVASWKMAIEMDYYEGMDFNGDFSEFAHLDQAGGKYVCKVFEVADDQLHLKTTIPLEAALQGDGFSMSDDGRILSDMMSRYVDGRRVVQPWIFDRKQNKAFTPEEPVDDWGYYESMKPLHGSPQVAYLTPKPNPELVIFDVATQAVAKRIDLPLFDWKSFFISPDDRFAVVYQTLTSHIAVVDIESGLVSKLDFPGPDITTVAWRPDGLHLAIATQKEIFVWDFALGKKYHQFPHHEINVTQLEYIGNGRLLAASGWRSATHIYDPVGEKLVLRCESFLAEVSADGNEFVLQQDEYFNHFRVDASDLVAEFDMGTIHFRMMAGIHSETATLWFAMTHKVGVVDLVQNRFVSNLYADHWPGIDLDPQGRDTFIEVAGVVRRLPYSKRSRNRLVFGPAKTILDEIAESGAGPATLQLSGDGNRIGINSERTRCEVVLDRNDNWNILSHTHAKAAPIRTAPHPFLPVVTTSTHHAEFAEVRNTETDEIVLSFAEREAETRFLPDGSKLILACDGVLSTYDVRNWQQIRRTKNSFPISNDFTTSADSQWILAESVMPRGAVLLDSETLEAALSIPGDPLHPESTPACIDPNGRFLATTRGATAIGVWDLYKLRQHFESLDLEWPLPGLGNPTPLRDPKVDIEVIWESAEPEPAL